MLFSNCISLRTNDQMLESLFTAHAKKGYLKVDRVWSFLKACVTAFFVISILAGALPATKAGAEAWLVYLAVLVLHNGLMHRWPNFYSENRDCVVMLLKLVLMVLLMNLVVTFTLAPIHSVGAFVKQLIMGGGIVLLNCTGLCMPVVWRHHLKASLATFVVFNSTLLPSVVDTLMCTAASRRYVYMLYKIINATAFSIGGMLLPFHGVALPDVQPRAQAYTIVLWLQLVLGLLVPSVYLYCYEIRSRMAFLQQVTAGEAAMHHSQHPGTSSGLQAHYDKMHSLCAALPPLPLMAVLATMCSVVVWTLLHTSSGWVASLVDSLPSATWGAWLAGQHGAASCVMLIP